MGSTCILGIGLVLYGEGFDPIFCGQKIIMRKYKLVLVFKSDIKKEAKEKVLKGVSSWGGKVEKSVVTELGEKKFAYPIKGNQKGDYVLVEFESDSVSKELDEKVRINEEILRHLLVRV